MSVTTDSSAVTLDAEPALRLLEETVAGREDFVYTAVKRAHPASGRQELVCVYV